MRYSCSISVATAIFLLATANASAQDASLSEVDANDDGTVSVTEFKEYASGKLQGFDRMNEFVNAVDADGNGKISEKEFSNRMTVLQNLSRSMQSDDADSKDEKDKESDKDAKARPDAMAKKVFENIKKLIAEDKWEEAAKLMTKKAQDELIIEQTISAIGLSEMDVDIPIPQLEDAVDEISDVLVKHGINDLKIDASSMFKFKMSMGDDADDSEEELEKEMKSQASSMEENGKKILDHVKKSGKQWEIVKDLWEAKKASPFSMSPLSGKVNKQEVDGENQLLYVTVAPSESNGDSGMVVQMIAPPSVMRMKKVGDDWKLDGRDEKRTAKAMQEFMKEQQGNLGGGPPREDF